MEIKLKTEIKRLNGYSFLNEPPLGKGTFGTVYSVYDTNKHIYCAAKCISRKFISDKGLNEQMRNEMTIHKKLKHKNIVEYMDQFSTVNEIFIILEKCNSETLEKICSNYYMLFGKHMSVKLTRHFLIQVSEAVNFMHSKGIAHRDIKLENIMLKFDNEIPIDETNIYGYFYYNTEFIKSWEKFEEIMLTSAVKIIDLGFAKELDSKGTKSFLGTPAYLAPEVLKKKSNELTPDFSYSSKVDTWAIGVMTFHIITGEVPFTINKNINTFNDLYNLHKKGIYTLSKDLVLTMELLDYLNALLQFDEDERINIDDMVEHPFLKTEFEKQKEVLIKDLITDNSSHLILSTTKRKNYISFGYDKKDRISKIDENLLVNDKIIDEIFGIQSKVTIYERQENGYTVISTKKVMYNKLKK